MRDGRKVLILIVMEHALGALYGDDFIVSICGVLILIVMEHALGDNKNDDDNGNSDCLNPCCNGIWSRTPHPSRCRRKSRYRPDFGNESPKIVFEVKHLLY